ncbi:MAG: hypothetical protein J6X18_05935 [Bacteroidales bacterium]|nr:hypothetical protein [Bacteroidales bacterium]
MEIVVTYENPNSEDSIQDNIVAEPIGEYKPTEKPPYAGTSINRAVKDYYACQTNREKVSVLQWIVENPEYQVLKRYSTAENAVFGLNISQYDDILLSGEMPKNLAIAQKLVMNKFDVFLLTNPTSTKSADFVLRQNNKLYYVEGKTLDGKNSLDHLIEKGSEQSNRVVIDIVGTTSTNYIKTIIEKGFERYSVLQELFLLKGSRLIRINRQMSQTKTFMESFKKVWNKNK